MYLEQATVQSLLAAAAGMSPEGSAFVGLSITQPVLDRLRAKKLAAAYGGATGDSQGQSLLETWVFGCPQDPTQVGGRAGAWVGGRAGRRLGWCLRACVGGRAGGQVQPGGLQ